MRRTWKGNSTANRLKERARSILPRGRFIRGVTVLAGGAALGQAINVLVSPAITRLYSPADFGVFAVYASVLGIVTVVASLCFEYAIPIPEDDESAANILGFCFVILLGTNVLSWLAIYALGDQIVKWTNIPGLRSYLWLIPLWMLGAGTYTILNYWAIRKRDYVSIGRTQLSRAVARASIQTGLGYAISGPIGLLLAQVAGESAGSASLGKAAWKEDHASFRAISLQNMYKAATRYKNYSIFIGTARLMDSLASNAPQLLFATFYGAEVAGWFALGQYVIGAPLNIVVNSIDQVYFGEASRVHKNDPQSMRRLFLGLTKRLALIGTIPIAVICILAPWFFPVVFGPSWETTGRYVQFLGLMFATRFAVHPLQNTLTILERQDLFIPWECIRLVMVLGILSEAKAWGFSGIVAVAAYSLSMLAVYILLWIIAWRILTRACKKQQLGDWIAGERY